MQRVIQCVDQLEARYPKLACVRGSVVAAYRLMEACYLRNGKLLVAGNGGSAADSEHIVGELMKRFRLPRPVPSEFAAALEEIDPVRGGALARNLDQSLMAIPLASHESLITAYMNDAGALGVFAQQVYGYGRRGDVFLGISTSGRSENILYAAVAARALEIPVIGLTGQDGGELAQMADVAIQVPESETYKVQELHLPVYHCLCMMLEKRFFGKDPSQEGNS